MTKDEITKELRERTGDWELLSQEAKQSTPPRKENLNDHRRS